MRVAVYDVVVTVCDSARWHVSERVIGAATDQHLGTIHLVQNIARRQEIKPMLTTLTIINVTT